MHMVEILAVIAMFYRILDREWYIACSEQRLWLQVQLVTIDLTTDYTYRYSRHAIYSSISYTLLLDPATWKPIKTLTDPSFHSSCSD